MRFRLALTCVVAARPRGAKLREKPKDSPFRLGVTGAGKAGWIITAIGRLKARETDRRQDWVEKTSTRLSHRFDLIRVEDLKIRNMIRSARGTIAAPGKNVRAKAGLNQAIHAAGWGRLVNRPEDKAPGRVEKIVTSPSRPTDPGRPPVRGALQPLGGAANREPQPVLSSGWNPPPSDGRERQRFSSAPVRRTATR
jgi:hypothetical protein